MAKVLIVVPHDRFRDEEFISVYNALTSASHQVQIGSSHHTEATGHFGLTLKPDVNIAFVEPKDYDAVIFIGGRGVEEYFTESNIHNLIKNFFTERKLVGAIGLAVELLSYAGILAGKRVTCHPDIIQSVQGAGAYYTGRQVETDGDVITSIDERTSEAFAEGIIKGLDYLRERGRTS
jgi:protease I